MRKSSWFCTLVGFFVGSRAWSSLLSSRAAVRRVSVSLTRNELEGQHPSDAAGSGRLSVPVLCFRDLSVVANALKAGCRARAPHLEARADSPRPPSRRERATRSQTGALLLSAPAAARQGDGVSGEARGTRGAGLRPRLRGAAPRAPGVLVLGGTGRSGRPAAGRRGPLPPRSRESGGGFCPAAVRSRTGWAGGRFPTARAGARRPGTPVRGRAGAGVRRSGCDAVGSFTSRANVSSVVASDLAEGPVGVSPGAAVGAAAVVDVVRGRAGGGRWCPRPVSPTGRGWDGARRRSAVL